MGISKNFEYSKWVWAKNIWVHIFELKFLKKWVYGKKLVSSGDGVKGLFRTVIIFQIGREMTELVSYKWT